MKTANIFSKLKRAILAVAFCLVATFAFVIPSSLNTAKSANAAGGLTFTSYSSTNEIKTNATKKEFIVYGEISNNATSLFGAQFTINIDVDVLEFKEFMTPAQIATELNNSELSNTLNATEDKASSDKDKGFVICSVDNNFQPITLEKFIVGGYKIGVKDGVTLTDSTVTVNDVIIPDYTTGADSEFTPVGTSISVKSVEPSNECDITDLTSSQEGVTIEKDGANFKAEVPYSVTSLDTSKLKATVSDYATVAYSPNGSVELTEGQATSITVTVTAENGTDSKTATLSVTRKAGETVNTLSALTVKNGSTDLLAKTESELASGGTFGIEGEIANADKDNISIVTAKNGTNSTVAIDLDGTNVYTGTNTETEKTLALTGLAAGDHTVTITVTAETGATTQYTVTFKVAAAAGNPDDPNNPDNPDNPNQPDNPNKPGDTTKPGVGTPDDDNGFYLPPMSADHTLTNTPTFTGDAINVKDYLGEYFNEQYMELSGDQTATKAGDYTVTIKLKEPDKYHWKESTAKAASVKMLRSAVVFAEEATGTDSFNVKWKIAPFDVPVSSWSVAAGELPKLNGLTQSLMNCLNFAYTTEDGAPVDPANLEVGTKYLVTAAVKPDFVGSIRFADGSGNFGSTATYGFTYESAPVNPFVAFFTQQVLGLPVWSLLLIALAVIALIVLIIVIAVTASRKRKEKKASEPVKAKKSRKVEKAERQQVQQTAQPVAAVYSNNDDKWEQQERRWEHEERMARAQAAQVQPQAQTQFVPIPQSQPQTQTQFVPIPQSSNDNSAEIAALMAEISALKAGQNTTHEATALRAEHNSTQDVAALRAEISALRAEQASARDIAALRAEYNSSQGAAIMAGNSNQEAALRAEISALRAEQASAQETAALRAEISALKAEQASAHETAALRAEISALKAGNSSNQEVAALRAEMNALRAGNTSAQETAALRAEISALRSEHNTSQEAAALRAEMNALKAEQASNQEAAALRAEINALKSGNVNRPTEAVAYNTGINSSNEVAALRAEMNAMRLEQATAKEIAALRAEINAKEIASLHNNMPYVVRGNEVVSAPVSVAPSSVSSEIAALRTELNSKEITSLYNDMTYAKRGNEVVTPVMPVQAGVSAKELSEMISTAVRSAVADVIPRETHIVRTSEDSRVRVVKPETAQPAPVPYAPDAVTTTVTTTRVDTTKKSGEQLAPREMAESDTDGMIFDVGGFYDPATERDLKTLNRRTENRHGNKHGGK